VLEIYIMANGNSNASSATLEAIDLPGHFDHVFIQGAERLSAILKSIARMADGEDLEIAVMARHGAEIADELYGDLDVFCENFKRCIGPE
jgi:precorrin-6B methylase 2